MLHYLTESLCVECESCHTGLDKAKKLIMVIVCLFSVNNSQANSNQS